MCATSLPAYEQASEAVVPRVRSFDDPAPRLATDFAEQGLLTAPSDVWSNSAKANRRLDVLIVVAFVEAKVRGTSRPARTTHDNGIEHLVDHACVRDIRAGDERGDRHTASIGQDVPFDAAFRTICRVRPREVPPFGAFTEALSNELHFNATPRRPW